MAMMYAMFTVVASATMVSVALNVSISNHRQAQVTSHGTRAKYLAEGALEFAKHDLAEAVANWVSVPAGGTATIDGVAIPYRITATGFDEVATDGAGIQTIITGYELAATAQVQGHRFTAHRLVNCEATPIFQFAVFYTNDLEINPGPNMTLGGRVHSNSDMYLNCGGTLTVNTNYVRAVGSLYRNRKDDPDMSEGTVNVRKWVGNPFSASEPAQYMRMNSVSQMNALGIGTESGYDSRFTEGHDGNGDGDFDDPSDWYDFVDGAAAYWGPPAGYAGGSGQTLMTGQHGVTQAAVPHIGSIAMYEPVTGGDYVFNPASGQYVATSPGTGTHDKGFYHQNADLSVITNAAGVTRAYDRNGVDITATLPGVFSNKTMYDARQANGGTGNVSVTQIDLAVLRNLNKWPANGLIYAAQYGAGTGAAAKGVRLVNGAQLGGKLTVASEDPIYIKGSFNTTNKVGAAVIADAVNLLSDAWNDTKTKTSGLPTATATTYNVALITGNQDTVAGGQYNGGLENLPRFHENWSGKNCTITGSFVNTWTSRHATGNWVYGSNRYTAPNRIWNYDSGFNSVANLPPFTPMAVTAVDVCAW